MRPPPPQGGVCDALGTAPSLAVTTPPSAGLPAGSAGSPPWAQRWWPGRGPALTPAVGPRMLLQSPQHALCDSSPPTKRKPAWPGGQREVKTLGDGQAPLQDLLCPQHRWALPPRLASGLHETRLRDRRRPRPRPERPFLSELPPRSRLWPRACGVWCTGHTHSAHGSHRRAAGPTPPAPDTKAKTTMAVWNHRPLG